MESGPANPVTEDAIEAVEELRSRGEFSEALHRTQDMLSRVTNEGTRMRLLFDVAICAGSLDRPEIIEAALAELEKMPKPDISRVLVNMNRACAETSLGRPQNALHILDTCLASGLFESDDMRIHKYQLCLHKGEALLHLGRPAESLEWLDRGHELVPNLKSATSDDDKSIFGWVEPRIQIKRANCLISLSQYEEAYRAAERVLNFQHSELTALALQYMAECRVWQGRVSEALKLYADLKPQLPSRLVNSGRVDEGIANCVALLERRRPSGRPS